MKRSITAVFCCFCLAGAALADDSVIDKTESAIERGAEATAHGIKRGVEAAGHGIRRCGSSRSCSEVGLSAAGRGIRRGADATERAFDKVAKKVSPSSGS